MTDNKKEIIDSLITSVKLENYRELTECFIRQIHEFKFDMGGLIKSMDPNHYYQVGQMLRDLKTRVELISKLSDFIDYVGVLQGTIETED